MPPGRQAPGVCVQITVPENADEKEQKRALRFNSPKEFGTEIGKYKVV